LVTSNGLTRIAVDAMGGDNAPAEIVAGAVQAARNGEVQVMLVGDPEQVEAELANHDTSSLPIGAVPSEGVIAEGESPITALRQTPRASILVSTGMVKKGLADGCVTMGSTGAAMAAGAFLLGMIKGIERPALGGPVIGLAPRTVVIDLGANVDGRPAQLLSFAVMGDVFARQFWGVERPRVAMLSVGSEASKGNRQTRETSELLSNSRLNFVGNVEANDLASVDVAVCDGFVGNIVMKLTEGLGQGMSDHVRTLLEGKLPESEVDRVARSVYELNNVVETVGGGPLLGVNGVSVVGHGRARADAVEHAIGTAKFAVESGFIAKLNEELPRVTADVEE
jgi:glycerol-3-phosphate acyltransferase PlsX